MYALRFSWCAIRLTDCAHNILYVHRRIQGDPNELHATALRHVAAWEFCVKNHSEPWCLRKFNPQQLV
jgi:hypothetical protein